MSRSAPLAFLLDLALVVTFAAVGRATHNEPLIAGGGDGATGLLDTAWPFALALVAGWVVTLAWRRPLAPVRTGLGVWAVTVAAGMLLRAISGQGTALAFIIVATLTLLMLLVGWRVIAASVRRSRARTTAP